ncbi:MULTISPECIES: UDP-glucose 4-epimerase GalE [Pseudomonas]|uniref:UDP-glucose 4-epimerase GalE n=1 Tax=Pseudomonas TaxID=286 RepID=UPI0009E83041|nr:MULTISPECIES: UDP-glucose 4-epimerase GalE [Pseudomonas]
MKNTILVTGGAGYIGSHAVLALLEADHQVVVLDNLSNSSSSSLENLYKITGKKPVFFEGDISDEKLLGCIFEKYKIDSVFHFAGLKAVGESVSEPVIYYENNVVGTLRLLKCMATNNVFKFIFSSSATVYGEPAHMPISESSPTGKPTNPYGRTKLIIEEMLGDFSAADPRWSIAILRYFNPIGAHESGQIGENPKGTPNNLLPYISQVAVGKRKELTIFGNDHATHDGTGVRDYIHVVDLVDGHIRALKFISNESGIHTWNLGTGRGYSVLEIVNAFEKIAEKQIPYRYAERRFGDIAASWADAQKAARELKWTAIRTLDDMILDTWRWQSNYPEGYPEIQ